MEKKWYVYILRCRDNSLYTGMTDDLQRRLEAHNAGKGAKYTRGRGPVVMVYYEEFATRAEACSREYRIKRLRRREKLDIIKAPTD